MWPERRDGEWGTRRDRWVRQLLRHLVCSSGSPRVVTVTVTKTPAGGAGSPSPDANAAYGAALPRGLPQCGALKAGLLARPGHWPEPGTWCQESDLKPRPVPSLPFRGPASAHWLQTSGRLHQTRQPSQDRPRWGSESRRLMATVTSYLTAEFFRGSVASCRADRHRGEASILGTVFGVSRGRAESRRPAGVGRADVLAELGRPEERLAGVLWTATLERPRGDLGTDDLEKNSNDSAHVLAWQKSLQLQRAGWKPAGLSELIPARGCRRPPAPRRGLPAPPGQELAAVSPTPVPIRRDGASQVAPQKPHAR